MELLGVALLYHLCIIMSAQWASNCVKRLDASYKDLNLKELSHGFCICAPLYVIF